MRAAFIRALCEIAAQDPKVVLLTGDLGFMALEPFRDRFPERFFNVGVAEQNMIGMALGLAERHYTPFCYSIATFATMRGYEFIRHAAGHGAPIRIVGMGGGFEYGTAGPSHHALEDLAIMRAIPGVRIVAPADHRQAYEAVKATWHGAGKSDVIYYRLGKDDKTEVPSLDGAFTYGEPEWYSHNLGYSVLVLSTGAITTEVTKALDILDVQHHIQPDFAIVSSFERIDLSECEQYDLIVTVEEHGINGGLGSLVAEQMAEEGYTARLVRCAARPDYLISGVTGSTAWLRQRHGLDAESIVRVVMDGYEVLDSGK